MEDEELRKLAEAVEASSEPIDFDQLIKDGLLIKKGRSYYAPNIHELPKKISLRIKKVAQTKNGLRVTFSK